jgi:hypothetical protein
MRITVSPGVSIREALHDARAVADSLGEPVTLVFNGNKLSVSRDVADEVLIEEYLLGSPQAPLTQRGFHVASGRS